MTYIAGNKTAQDWKSFLEKEPKDELFWASAFADYFYKRLETRYLSPIRTLTNKGCCDGEGFSIVAIQCSLIEFLESTYCGIKYRRLKKGEVLEPFEYQFSGEVFKRFLTTRDPFKDFFNEELATEFYSNVRCGILHEAMTNNGWRIHAKSKENLLIDTENKIVFRDDFQAALELYIKKYGQSLTTNEELQSALVRKFNALCE
tara:strand:- start:6952 stop:7560 length:609 start_codon:yes stop_codon:yes gene_type:complete